MYHIRLEFVKIVTRGIVGDPPLLAGIIDMMQDSINNTIISK